MSRKWSRLCRVTLLILAATSLHGSSLGLAQPGPDKRLIQKTTVAAHEVPLRDLLQQLCDKHKLKLEIDQAGLQAEGLNGLQPVSLNVDGVTLGSALNLLFHNQGLSYFVDKGTLTIQTQAAADEALLTRNYPLAGLGFAAADPQALANALQVCGTYPWEDVDGVGGQFISVTPQSLTIEQSRAAHDEISDLLERLASVATGKRRPPAPVERAEDLIRKALAKPAGFPAGEMTVVELADHLQTAHKVNAWIDAVGLQDEGIDPAGTTVTLSAKKQPLAGALTEAFQGHSLAWLIRDEVLQITTQTQVDDSMVAGIYDIRRQNRPATEVAAQLEQMTELGPWENVDGVGGATAILGPLLLIRHTPKIHDKLATLVGPGR